MRCAIYRRVSTDMQVNEGVSLDTQTTRLYEFASSQGWTIIEDYVDEGFSAKNVERPAVQKLMKDITLNKFDVLLVYKLDRLARSVSDLYELLQLMELHDVKFRSATEVFDTTSAMGKLFITIVAALAQWERETIAERVYDNLKARAESGKRNGGPPPYGYKYDENGNLIVIPEEAKWVKYIFDKYQTNGSANVAKLLNKHGAKTKKGNPFSDFTVRGILRNPIYCGYNRWNRRSPVKGKAFTGEEIIVPLDQENFEIVISKKEFDLTQKKIKSRGNFAFKGKTHYPFSGVAICARCGRPFSGSSKTHNSGHIHRFYKCQGRFGLGICDMPAISELKLQEAFLSYLNLSIVSSNIEDKSSSAIDREQINQKLKSLQVKVERVKELYIDGEYTKSMKDKKLREFSTEKEELEQLLIEDQEEHSKEEQLAAFTQLYNLYPELTFESQKKFISRLISKMVIDILPNENGKMHEVEIKSIER